MPLGIYTVHTHEAVSMYFSASAIPAVSLDLRIPEAKVLDAGTSEEQHSSGVRRNTARRHGVDLTFYRQQCAGQASCHHAATPQALLGQIRCPLYDQTSSMPPILAPLAPELGTDLPPSAHRIRLSLPTSLTPPQRLPGRLPATVCRLNVRPRAAQNLPSISDTKILPPGHHLIHFPPSIPGSELLPDGTDPLQSPGAPFVRRMWAGGSVRFDNTAAKRLRLDGKRAACLESIRDVSVKGKEGSERVFVGIERRVGRCGEHEGEDSIRDRLWAQDEAAWGESAVVERRNIVFMRERTPEEASAAVAQQQNKIVKAAHEPTYSHTLTPNPNLLFRYSALTFNAHSIHLDPHYCRAVEGHRSLLLHGPLSFTFMITLLRLHCLARYRGGRGGDGFPDVKEISYRNIAPLYSGEPVTFCGRAVDVDESGAGKWEVWAQNGDAGMAVKGTAVTERVEGDPKALYEDVHMHFA